MVIDSSALIAVLENEPSADHIAEVMESATVILLSAANLVEAYALAKSRQLPLLFVGRDFAQTDIESAL